MINVHIIIGEDDYLVAETAKKLTGDGVGLEVIDSINATNAELQMVDLRAAEASLMTPPFLDPRKVTWWKNVGFLPQGGKGGPSEEVKEALENFAERLVGMVLPENQTFILTGPRLLMSSVFAKTLKRTVEIAVFDAPKPWEQAQTAARRAIDFAQDAGFTFAPEAVEAFAQRVGSDTRSIKSEIGKLRDYLGDGCHVATVRDVADITSQGVGVEPAIWDITKALGARKVGALVAAVRPFERESGFAVFVTTVVEKFLRQMAELKDAQTRGMLDQAARVMNPRDVRDMTGFLRYWTLRELRIARHRFLALRERSVSSSGATDVLVVTELIRACRRS